MHVARTPTSCRFERARGACQVEVNEVVLSCMLQGLRKIAAQSFFGGRIELLSNVNFCQLASGMYGGKEKGGRREEGGNRSFDLNELTDPDSSNLFLTLKGPQ